MLKAKKLEILLIIIPEEAQLASQSTDYVKRINEQKHSYKDR